jgi:hypothetical protein
MLEVRTGQLKIKLEEHAVFVLEFNNKCKRRDSATIVRSVISLFQVIYFKFRLEKIWIDLTRNNERIDDIK